MIYITGGIDGANRIAKLNCKNFKEQKQMSSNDYLIICGDFKLVYNNSEEEKRLLNLLAKKHFKILLVEGANENFDLLNDCNSILFNGTPAQKIAGNIIRLKRGYIYNIDNYKILTIGGGIPKSKVLNIPHSTYWTESLPTKEDIKICINSIKANKYKVDYIITADSPNSFKEKFNDGINISEYGEFLDRIKDVVKFKKWYCSNVDLDKITSRFICLNNYFYKIGEDKPINKKI